MNKIKLSLVFAATLALNVVAQKITSKSGDIFGTRVFIENKGQFDALAVSEAKIKYALENGNEKIYFNDNGLTYVMIKRYPLTQEQREEKEKGKPVFVRPNEVYKVHMNWLNCNKNIQIVESEKQHHYFTYGGPELNSNCFKKITYLNVYNNIDIEYFIPEDKSSGIKYNVVLHPGAKPSQIKIAYTGNVNSISVSDNGNVEIKTPLEPIIEHKPVSFQNNNLLATGFTINDGIIGFKIEDKYNSNSELVIDPWVTNISSLNPNNCGYDVDFDFNGNLFVYGGGTVCMVAKYNNVGVLQWTFPGTVASIAWSSNVAAYNFVVHRTSGKVYVGKSLGASIIRLDQAGNYDNLVSNNVPTWTEIWDMAYHCSTGKVYGLGGSTASNETAGIMDQVTGSITPVAFFLPTTSGHDVVSHAIDNTGEVYFLYASMASAAFMDNRLAKINTAFTNSVWINPTGYLTMVEASNKTNFAAGPVTSNGFNALAANNNYLFYYDGFNLAAYNKTTGSFIASTTITGYSPKAQGGIAVDDCDNVYIGGNNDNILSYKFTGSAFVALPGITLNVTSAAKQVYDVVIDKPNKLLYVSGSGFCGTWSAVNSLSCSLVADCNYSIPSTNTAICFGAVATISIGNPNNLTNPSYSIQPGGQVQASPVFTVSPGSTTNYTMFITGLNSTNSVVTNTTNVLVTVFSSPNISPVVLNPSCSNIVTNSVNLNVTFNPSSSPNYTVAWSPLPGTVTTVNSGTAAGLVPGVNNVTVTTANGCTATASFTVASLPLPASFTVYNPSNNYTITCNNPNVLLTTSVTNGVPLSYTWFPNCSSTLTGSSYNFTTACIGQVVGSSSTGCTMTQTYTIYQDLSSPTIVITPTTQNISCNVAASCFTLTSNMGPNVTTNWYQVSGTNTVYVGAAQGTLNIFCPNAAGVYWGESKNNITGCVTTKSVLVTASVGVPIFTVTSPSNFTIGCSTTSITSMQITSVITSPTLNVPVSYTFLPPGSTVVITPTTTLGNNPNQNNIVTPGTWVVWVKDLTNNCLSSQSVSIIQNTIAPNVDFIQPLSILSCKDPSMVLNGISTNPNTSITWTVPATPSNSVNPTANTTVTIKPSVAGSTNNITVVGVYTVGAVDNNNLCRAVKTATILQDIRLPVFTISALSNSVINCKNKDVVIVPITQPTLAVALVPTYVWYPPTGSPVPGTQFNTTACGTHSALCTSVVNGCTTSATYTVACDFNSPALNIAPAFTLDCNNVPTVAITPSITGSTTGFTYSWTVPAGALTSNLTSSVLTSNLPGFYMVLVTNTINGCVNQVVYEVVEGGIQALFTPDPDFGYAPLLVTFTNTSSTSTGASSIISTWGFGDGVVTSTIMNSAAIDHVYQSAGTYTVYLKVQKGSCIDTAMRIVRVELPSKLEIPNVFTPNGDKANDVFRLRASNLSEIYIQIFDRWGTKVYEVTSKTGNFAWDGNNLQGKECSDGTYFYILKAKGEDAKEYDLRGNVSLFR